MLFSSTIFLFYFLPLFLVAYHLADKRYKNVVALTFSLVFYAWGAPKFVFFLVGACLIDFQLTRRLHDSNGKRNLILSLLVNVGLLGYFKYANFFVENFNEILGAIGIEKLEWTNVVLPIGISFFTFQKISYTLDVYWKRAKPLQKFGDYLLYIALFPQLIAGPIVRYNEVAEQITNRGGDVDFDQRLNGAFRFILGLAKKVLISNVLAEQVEIIYALPENELTSTLAWFAALCYTFHIYYDFAGYSEMAIGIGKILGFKFPENFNFPYLSRSITEFWQRWHMTLGAWMRDYLYIPLGGNKKGGGRTLLNLGIVFVFSGIWHGAAWNFLIWGVYHGLFLILERLFLGRLLRKLPGFVSVVYTFFLVVIGWVLFSVDSMQQASILLGRMFEFEFDMEQINASQKFISVFIASIIFSFFGMKESIINKVNLFQDTIQRQKIYVVVPVFIIAGLLFYLCLGELLAGGFNPFIYFRF